MVSRRIILWAAYGGLLLAMILLSELGLRDYVFDAITGVFIAGCVFVLGSASFGFLHGVFEGWRGRD